MTLEAVCDMVIAVTETSCLNHIEKCEDQHQCGEMKWNSKATHTRS